MSVTSTDAGGAGARDHCLDETTRWKELRMSTETKTPTGAGGRPETSAEAILSRLADRIPARFGATAVYGEPVERDGVTVVPVATAGFGFGAGGGSDPSAGGQGEGGGGGGMTRPAGYIELKDGRSRFVPIVHPTRMLALICGTVVAAIVLLRPPAGRQRWTGVLPGR
jgi:uncharacterized spore protein YtfJ